MPARKTSFTLLFVFCFFAAAAQNANQNKLDSFSAKFVTAIRANEKQHAWLVTDKSVFRAGEYLWFRAFVLNSVSQKPNNNSKFLFVDVVNEKDEVVKRVILDAATRQLNSRIQLPDSLAAGYYWLRAYTSQMLMSDTNAICVKPIYVAAKDDVGNLPRPKKLPVDPNEAPLINFYPEGGNVITGIVTTVALQATLTNGEPISIDGFLKDNADATVTKFTTNAEGFVKFDFEPSGFKKYKAVINWQGKDITYPLPAYNFYGGQIGVTKQYENYKLRILLGDSIYSKDALTYLVGMSRDSLVLAAIGNGQYELNVDGHRLPAGITTFYLFDKNFKQLSERSVYVAANNLSVNITPDKTLYAKRSKVTLDLAIQDADKHAIPSLITIAVSDSLLQNQEQCNAANMVFNMQNIGNGFSGSKKCFSDEEIDLLMMARNNTYQALTTANTPLTAATDDDLLHIRGRLLTERNEPAANRSLTLFSSSGGSGVFITDTTDKAGLFSFPLDVYPDSTQFAIEVKDLDNHMLYNTKLQLDTITFPHLKTPVALKRYPVTTSRSSTERLNVYSNLSMESTDAHHLPPVTVRDNSKPVDYDVTKRVSSYSPIISGKSLDGRITVDNLILGVSGLQLLNGYLVIHGLNAMKSPGASDEPMVLVEGAPVAVSAEGAIGIVSPVLNYLHNLNPKDIDFIEVLKDGNAANYGLRGGNGVILINLSNKGHNLPSASGNIKTFYTTGVSKPALFPIVNYDVKDKKADLLPDGRSTIFWNGNYVTGTTGNATFTFYTSDIPTTYNITVTGITAHGDIINKTISIKSK